MDTMKAASRNANHRISRILIVMLFVGMFAVVCSPVCAEDSTSTAANPGPDQIVYAPANGKSGPVIIAISGQSGRTAYQPYATELAKLGYYVVLVEGKDILNPEHTGPANLTKTIERAQHAPNAIPGKVAVIGFSLGGGGALYNAANMPEAVSVVIVYYPYTRTWANNMEALVKRFKVPVLMFAGGVDHYQNCCVVESAHAMEAAAKANKAPFELVVYPEADHGFNTQFDLHAKRNPTYRSGDTQDAWRRTLEMLTRYQPVQ